MSKKQRLKSYDQEAYKRYLNQEMSDKEAHAFERHLLNNEFESDALDGLSLLKGNELKDDLERINATIKTPKKSLWNKKVLYAAASVAIIFSVVSLLWFLTPQRTVFVSDNLSQKEILTIQDSTIAPTEEEIPWKEAIAPAAVKSKKEAEDKAVVSNKVQPAEVRTKEKQATPQKAASTNDKIDNKRSRQTLSLAEASKVAAADSPIKNEPAKSERATGSYMVYSNKSSIKTDTDKTIEVKGRVTDANNEPLPFASVIVDGKEIGAVTDTKGEFSLNIPKKDSSRKLVASSLGYKTQKIKSSAGDSTNFVLEEDVSGLSEVVVTGYQSTYDGESSEPSFTPAAPEMGLKKYLEEIQKSLKAPLNSTGKKESVIAVVKINAAGDIIDIKIKRSPNDSYSSEAIRAIRNGGSWNSATQNGSPVKDSVRIKIKFNP